MKGQRFSNHSGKVTCATTLNETRHFNKQTIMSRLGHRSTLDVTKGQVLVKSVSNALQPPSAVNVLSQRKKDRGEERNMW